MSPDLVQEQEYAAGLFRAEGIDIALGQLWEVDEEGLMRFLFIEELLFESEFKKPYVRGMAIDSDFSGKGKYDVEWGAAFYLEEFKANNPVLISGEVRAQVLNRMHELALDKQMEYYFGIKSSAPAMDALVSAAPELASKKFHFIIRPESFQSPTIQDES